MPSKPDPTRTPDETSSIRYLLLRVWQAIIAGGAVSAGDFFVEASPAPASAWTPYPFGFTSLGMIFVAETTNTGDIEFSFDAGTTVHGSLSAGREVTFDDRQKSTVHIRGGVVTDVFQVYAW